MKLFDVVKIINDSGYTKSNFSKAVGLSRPTIDKCINQFESTLKCGNSKLLILFSRFTFIENNDKISVDREIIYANEAIKEINDLLTTHCLQLDTNKSNIDTREIKTKLINTDINDSDKLSLRERPITGVVELDYIYCLDCGGFGTLSLLESDYKLICNKCNHVTEPYIYGIAEYTHVLQNTIYPVLTQLSNDDNIEEYKESSYEVGQIVHCKIVESSQRNFHVRFGSSMGRIKRLDILESFRSVPNKIGTNIEAKIIGVDRGGFKLIMTSYNN